MERKKIPRSKQKRSFESKFHGGPQWFFKACFKRMLRVPCFWDHVSFFCEKFIKMWNGQIWHNSIANLPKLKANHLPPMMDTEAIRRWQGMRRVPISGILAGGCWGEQLRQPALSLSDLFGVVQSPSKCVIGLLQGILKKKLLPMLQFRGGMQHRKRDLVQKVDEQSGKWKGTYRDIRRSK